MKRGKRREVPAFKHPLEDMVLSFFDEREIHDCTTVAYRLAGNCSVHPGARAYNTVARDVLLLMTRMGLLYRDAAGWWHKRPPADAPGKTQGTAE